MSLRRSARVQSHPRTVENIDAAEVAAPTKKRGRPGKGSKGDADSATPQDAGSTGIDTSVAASMPPPPTTPNKRRKVASSPVKPPPITPTPSAIGFMTSSSVLRPTYSTGDIDDATPPPADRPAEPHHTNATLVTPGGTQVQPTYSNFEESPSKPTREPTTTSSCLLDEAVAHLLNVDSTLKPVLDKHHCRVFSPAGLAESIDPFRSLSSGIMAQQVSGAAAKSIKNKFVGLFPPEDCPNGFPTPAVVAETSLPRLREAGLSQRKAEYIQGLAQKFVSGELTIPMLMNGSDEEVMTKLVAVRGLGAWSVEMFMCFGLKRMDVFSTGDLGVQRGMAAHAGKDVAKLKAKGGGKFKYMSEKEMLERAEVFRPYRSLFMWYMWRVEDVDVEAVENN
ncbi:3-methyladenine DNA glycosylase [Elasticomyces elasticus]|nr:3-methyladenine DNA glycosylase [Elasticomyces elasticus]KAK3663538.1 3-methyladenine DNA glycosylase [Elasticomyces elasticus]KAK4927075.1 3-methyladenine DNA glycosylase [Elasticomyces elasticus]KAK5769059.1 3-methyladenine DNA glycosylase [Elasticomyces elasticus]